MPAFRFFDPWAGLDNAEEHPAPANAAKPAKAATAGGGKLAALAALAPVPGEFANLPSWGEAAEERAAVVEYEGVIPREWAEGFARLDPDRPSGDVPLKRWQRFVDDVGLFLDGPFCAVAKALGWGPHDLFGCDRGRPFARIDRAGLLWLVNGDKLVALSEDAAGIETRAGGERHTYRRKPAEPGRVLAWELAL